MTRFRRGGSDHARATSLPTAVAPRLSGRPWRSWTARCRVMPCWRITPSFRHDDPGRERVRLGVEQVDQRGAVGENLPLVDVTLVGDLAGVKAGRAGHDQQPLDPGRRPRVGVVGASARASSARMDSSVIRSPVGARVLAEQLARLGRVQPGQRARGAAVLARDHGVGQQGGGGQQGGADRADPDERAGVELEVLRDPAPEHQPGVQVIRIGQGNGVAGAVIATGVERGRGEIRLSVVPGVTIGPFTRISYAPSTGTSLTSAPGSGTPMQPRTRSWPAASSPPRPGSATRPTSPRRPSGSRRPARWWVRPPPGPRCPAT